MKYLFFLPLLLFAEPRFLHIGFHKTCLAELEYVGKELGISIESLDLFFTTPEAFDGTSPSHDFIRHVMTKERADAVWRQNEAYFRSFDGYIVSDPVSLFRIFARNAPEKPLLIWICNRFDSPSPGFPDKAYYDDFQIALLRPNVKAVAYTPYEIVHLKSRHITGLVTQISPIGIKELTLKHKDYSPLPSNLDKKNLFFVRKYLNETSMNLSNLLTRYDIPHYMGPYEGPKELAEFKGVIHVPAVMSNFFLFENLSLGLVQFIPSKAFFLKLSQMPGFVFRLWSKPKLSFLHKDVFAYSDWYSPKYAPFLIYFDSWSDLKVKLNQTDIAAVSQSAKAFAEKHRGEMLVKWKGVFDSWSSSYFSPVSSSPK